ncbi:FkbM family methyltransferase [Falsiroseomonas sp.]|uniref:FkbM family methyltransferase n=1 Tax=Falsiroseomonas sp. TaxID=2870721 RepID=UPI0027337E32|nr:FkbM family methyltransferase [Falsiroseomonas sp.]MDP3414756.1 FkbM family methyltransferase [Falsiroseomonas sp.]
MRVTDAFRRAPIAASVRAARFTLSELSGRDFSFFTPDGTRLTTMPNNFSSFAMCVAGARDPQIWRFVERHLQPGEVFVDAGANIGAYTIPAARLVGPTGRVISFEAHPHTFRFLQTNIDQSGLSWAAPLNLALGEVPGEIEIVFADSNPGETHVASSSDGRGVSVPMQTLDAALAEQGVIAVSYLKIDVEGFELPVLRGALGTIASSPRIAVQTEMEARHAARYGYRLEAIGDLLQGAGLRPHHLDATGAPRALEGALRGDVIWLR